MIKKLIVLLISAVLCAGMCVTASADEAIEEVFDVIEEDEELTEFDELDAQAGGSYTVNKSSLKLKEGETGYITITANNAAGRIDWSSTGTVSAKGSAWLDKDKVTISVEAVRPGKGSVKIIPVDMASYGENVLSNEVTVTVTVECIHGDPNCQGVKVLLYTRTLKKGMSGQDVAEVQKRLIALGYLNDDPDGEYGPITEAAVIAFQRANGLSNPDGMVGQWTIGKLNGNPAANSGGSAIGGAIVYTRTLAKGMSGEDVLIIQKKLKELGYLYAAPDGIYGAKTEAAVIAFQWANGLSNPDGMVGRWTIGKLNGNPAVNTNTLVYTRTLTRGMSGEDVRLVQKRLSELGFYPASAIDGEFGGQTEAAVNAFQKAKGLANPDGMVGKWTIGKLNNG